MTEARVAAHRDGAFERLADAGALTERVRSQAEAEVRALCVGSDWAVDYLCRHPALLDTLVASGAHREAPARGDVEAALAEALAEAGDDPDPDGPLGAALRRFRNAAMIGVLLRDLAGRARLEETTRALSDLADAVIDATQARLVARAAARGPVPRLADGTPEPLCVLALGKLGAHELNLSSDVDLIFLHERAAPLAQDEATSAQAQTHAAFFTRIGRELIGLLDARTAEGFVFRVDLRLRPFGEAGALVLHGDAFCDYYEESGRDWERYALIKARAVTGADGVGGRVLRELQPFVYRRYLDFGAIEALREMKSMIRTEVRRKGLDDDVKLGSGGIRDVEFVVQAHQLIHGGRNAALRERALLKVLPRLVSLGLLAEAAASELAEDYRFLRDVEHRIQGLGDAQTQRLPRGPLARARIAASLGFEDFDAFSAALTARRQRLAARFDAFAARPGDGEADAEDDRFEALWRDLREQAPVDGDARVAFETRLAEAGIAEGGAVVEGLASLAERAHGLPQDVERRRLDVLLPRLLASAAELEDGEARTLAVKRLLPLLEAVLRRSAYLALLAEQPAALDLCVRLAGASERIAASLARHPALLDELLDARTLLAMPSRERLAQELSADLAEVDASDQEARLECLRRFKAAVELRIAACELQEALPLMRVSDALSWLAEVLVDAALEQAWAETVAQYGPPADADGNASDVAVGVIGYGKLGGLELGWGSDLDLVFLHDLPARSTTLGERSVTAGQFLARLAQRLIHVLSTRTYSGALYEVDLRLRPSGRSGLLVTSVEAFAEYQSGEAWTWEHQALVRARPVAGAARVLDAFEAVRQEVLARPRRRETLREEIVSMRRRMREELAPRSLPEGEMDLKHAPGAVVDIEFMVQFLALGWARAHPELLAHTDAIRTLEAASRAGILAAAEAEFLTESYLAFRAEAHRRALEGRPARTADAELLARAERVSALWAQRMEPAQDAS